MWYLFLIFITKNVNQICYRLQIVSENTHIKIKNKCLVCKRQCSTIFLIYCG